MCQVFVGKFPSNIWNTSVYFLFEALVSIWETTESSKQMLQLCWEIYYIFERHPFSKMCTIIYQWWVYIERRLYRSIFFWVLRKSLSAQSCWKVEIESLLVCLRLIYFTCIENLSDSANWKPFSFSPSFQFYCASFLFNRTALF